MLLLVGLTILSLWVGTGANIQCLYCNDVVGPAECDTVRKCGSHERCYVDAFVSASGSIRYNLGCRDERICAMPPILGKRSVSYDAVEKTDREAGTIVNDFERSHVLPKSGHMLMSDTRKLSGKRASGILICTECCKGDLCGSTGCGNTGYLASRGPICFSCDQQNAQDDCSKIKMCSQGEVCMLEKTSSHMTHMPLYSTRCEGATRCQDEIVRYKELEALFHGKRRESLDIGGPCLIECCTSDLCNHNCGNSSMQTNVTTAGSSSPASSSPSHQTTTAGTGTGPSTASQTSKAPLASCIYNGHKYNQGDVWQDGCHYNCTCEDARTGIYRCQDLCPNYNNLPTGCTLEKKPGECCSQPNCGGHITTPGGTGTGPTTASQTSKAPLASCIYNSHKYNQGDVWQDGCQYNCTCEDARTGFYRCRDMFCAIGGLELVWNIDNVCPNYNNLPTGCTLEKKPGECCSHPNCGGHITTRVAAGCVHNTNIYNQGGVWQDGCQYNCTCVNATTGFYSCQDLCPTWNNLPSGCTLEKKPGECCSHPNCGGQSPSGTANTCYYGNKYYQEGDQWRDGCKYKCTCKDGKTGFYECQDLCLQWNLPSSCHLDPAPTGKCCEVPVCPSNVQLQFPSGYVQE